jgi:hypothetical protein
MKSAAPPEGSDRRTWQRAKRKGLRTPARGGYGRPGFGRSAPHLPFPGPPRRCGGPRKRIGASTRPGDRSSRLRPHFGGNVEPAPVEIRWAPALATGEPAHFGGRTTGPPKRLIWLRPEGVPHQPRLARKVPSRFPTASAAGHDGLGHRAPGGSPAASAAGRSRLRPSSSEGRWPARNRRKPAHRRRRTPTNLFATSGENPGNRNGRTRRMDGNGKVATDAETRKRLLTRGTLRRVRTAARGPGYRPRHLRVTGRPQENAPNPESGSGVQ